MLKSGLLARHIYVDVISNTNEWVMPLSVVFPCSNTVVLFLLRSLTR